MASRSVRYRSFKAGLLAGSLLLASGCKPGSQNATENPSAAPAARGDQQIAKDIESRLQGESALAGQNIQVSVNGGMATLSGAVNNDAARALAGVDSGSVSGVRTVINNLTVMPQQTAQAAPAEPQRPDREAARLKREEQRRHQNGQQRLEEQAANDQPTGPVPVPQPQEPVRTVPAAPAAPPPPVARTVSIASGTSLPVRLTEGLDSATAQQGQMIHGTLASDIIADNMLAIPRGTSVTGRVADAKDAAHFSGSALLSVELTQIHLDGRDLTVVTSPFVQQGTGRGKNTAEKTGGGAALGAIIGALAGGGKGAAIGAAAGGGIGAGANGVTRGQQVKIAPETLINFKLQSPISVTTTRTANGQPRSFDDNSGSAQPQ
jgi:BON domain